MLNDLMEKRKKILAESEQHKNRRNRAQCRRQQICAGKKHAQQPDWEFVEEAQKNRISGISTTKKSLTSKDSVTN